jgi:hypothetical protein
MGWNRRRIQQAVLLLAPTSPSYIQDASAQTLTATVTATLAKTPTAGNLLVASVGFQETAVGGGVINVPTGWAQVGTTLNYDGAVSYNYLALFTFPVPSSPATSYTFTATAGSGATVGGMSVQLSEFSGVYVSSPIDVSTTSSGSSTAPSFPSITTTRKNDTLIGFCGFDGRLSSGGVTFSPPSGYTSIPGTTASTTDPVGSGAGYEPFLTPGSTTATTGTLSTSEPWGTVLIALASISGNAVFLFSDSLSLTDSFDVQASASYKLIDSANLSDSVTTVGSASVKAVDSLALSDTFTGKFEAGYSFSDSFSLTDSIALIGLALFPISDLLEMSDSIAITAESSMQFQDELTLTDFVIFPVPIFRTIALSCGVAPSITEQLILAVLSGQTLSVQSGSLDFTLKTVTDIPENVGISLTVSKSAKV